MNQTKPQLLTTSSWALWTLLISFFYPSSGLALSSDRNQAMHIEADRAELDDRQGISTYQGNVKVSQGTMHLDANKLTIHNQKRNIKKIIANGAPAQFRQRPDNQQEDVRAQANRIEYYGEKNQVVLLGQAKVWQGGNVFESERIEYDLKKNVVNAGSKKSAITNGQRVHITIQPDQGEHDKNKDSAAP